MGTYNSSGALILFNFDLDLDLHKYEYPTRVTLIEGLGFQLKPTRVLGHGDKCERWASLSPYSPFEITFVGLGHPITICHFFLLKINK